jgi:hypothetical protein
MIGATSEARKTVGTKPEPPIWRVVSPGRTKRLRWIEEWSCCVRQFGAKLLCGASELETTSVESSIACDHAIAHRNSYFEVNRFFRLTLSPL